MSQEKIKEVLTSLGLTKTDVKVYIYLAKRGPKRASETAKTLKMSKQQLYPLIKNLQGMGVVTSTLERPARFCAVSFGKLIDLFTRAKIEEAKRIQQNKNELIKDWQSIVIKETNDKTEKFSVIEGRKFVYSKIQQMIQETKKQLSIVAPLSNLIRIDQSGFLDSTSSFQRKSKIKFSFLTELTGQNLNAGKSLLKRTSKTEIKIRGRNPELGLRLFPRMIIRDDTEILLFITANGEVYPSEEGENTLWTNCKSIINSFQCIFDELWQNSTDLKNKIREIETGKPTPKTQIISDSKTAKKKYSEILGLAKKDIIMMIPSKTLTNFQERIFSINDLKRKSLQIKIMAPITKENLEMAKQLSNFCEIRHISESYLGTTIVDGQHLFQLKIPKADYGKTGTVSSFENAFYSNDFEYVDRMKNMMDDLWKNACVPASVPLESIIQSKSKNISSLPNDVYTYSKPDSPYRKFIIPFEEKPRIITEKEVLEKIFRGTKYLHKNPLEDKVVLYGSRAGAVIHPPDYFELPDMLISVSQWNENSSFGAENWILISLWLETPIGKRFVPTAIIQNRPTGLDFKKEVYSGTPAIKNIQVIGNDQFQVRVYGNTLFAGWTKPISLISKKYVLPSACLLFEGYGDIKTGVIEGHSLSGREQIWEYNGFEAFVTFFHPASKYSGPGTDATFSRDVVLTSYPSAVNKK